MTLHRVAESLKIVEAINRRFLLSENPQLKEFCLLSGRPGYSPRSCHTKDFENGT